MLKVAVRHLENEALSNQARSGRKEDAWGRGYNRKSIELKPAVKQHKLGVKKPEVCVCGGGGGGGVRLIPRKTF